MKTRPETGPPEPAVALRSGAHRARRGDRHDLRDGLVYCLKVFLVVRVALALVALMAVALLPDLSGLSPAIRAGLPAIPGPVSVPGWAAHATTPGWHNLFTSWERFDALWYLRIATRGYVSGDGSAAFFPFYPLLIRGVSVVVGGHPLAAALLVSNGAFLGALFVLFVLGRGELGDDVARRAVLYVAVFPTALFFLAPYSESLFLLLCLLTFWGARRGGRWWFLAAGAGCLAALTRNLGVVLALPIAVESVHQAMTGRAGRRPLWGLLAAAGPPAGTFAYALYWHGRTSPPDWLAPVHQQAQWQRHLTDPAHTVLHGSQDAFRFVGIYPGGYHFLDWLIALPFLAFAIYAVLKLRPSYSAYAWASILIPLAYVFDGRPLMSFPRFALVVFPVFWAMALWTRGRPARHEIVVVASSILLGLMTLLFAAWYYVF